MVSELGGVQIEFGRAECLKCFGHCTVQGQRTGGWQVVVQHFTDEFVRKSVTAGSVWLRQQYADATASSR